jgi:1,4-dihydroxy-2-naphthoate octaprenyltransferase
MPSPLSVWISAARPKTLWAAFAPVLIGTAMAFADEAFHAWSALAALVGACCIQIGTNFWNDYADFKKGADTDNRTGPMRATQAGLISPKHMKCASAIMFGLALLIALALVARAGWPLLAIGLLSILFGYLYTGGPMPLGYVGLGDVLVLIFFGPVAVGGTYYVQALEITPTVLIAGFAPGLLSVAILTVNNLRDMRGDEKAGKRTLAVRFGQTFARREYVFCMLAGIGISVVLFYVEHAEHPYVLLAVLTLPLGRTAIINVCTSNAPSVLNAMLGRTAKLLLLYSVLFSIGWNL